MKRLLMTADTVGGVWTYALELARALGGAQVLLAVLGPEPSPAQRLKASLVPGLALTELGGRLEWMEGCGPDLERQGEALLALERDFRPDIVHVNGFAHGALPWSSPTLVAAHSCVWSWFRAVRHEDPPAEWRLYIERVRDGVAAADVVTAPSRAFLGDIKGLYRPTAPCRAIHNGRDAALFTPARKEPFILGAGRLWDEAKNVQALIDVAPRLDWLVAVAGPLGGRSPGAAMPLGTLAPTELARWMARAAIFAAPVRYEPFGLTALEAALSGCALVLGDIPSQREIWGRDALFVRDGGELQAALARLIADESLRTGLAARARKRALGYSAQAMAAGYRAAYALAAQRARGFARSA